MAPGPNRRSKTPNPMRGYHYPRTAVGIRPDRSGRRTVEGLAPSLSVLNLVEGSRGQIVPVWNLWDFAVADPAFLETRPVDLLTDPGIRRFLLAATNPLYSASHFRAHSA